MPGDTIAQLHACVAAASTATDTILRGVYVATARAVLTTLEADVGRARALVEAAERELVRLGKVAP